MGRSFSPGNDFSYIGNPISSRIPKLGKISDNRELLRKNGPKTPQGLRRPEL
jgi:hypothetical protein